MSCFRSFRGVVESYSTCKTRGRGLVPGLLKSFGQTADKNILWGGLSWGSVVPSISSQRDIVFRPDLSNKNWTTRAMLSKRFTMQTY